jgi:hypothetical protein
MPRDREPGTQADETERKQGMPGNGSDRAWWRPPSWSRSELLHEWIRLGGTLIALTWAIYTFIYKDIYVPSQQPAHLNLEASLKPVPDRPTTAGDLEMLLEIKATNSSSRRVYPLANIWTLRAINIDPRTGSREDGELEFIQKSNEELKGDRVQHTELGVKRSAEKLIAIGRLFGDDFINPGNTKNRSILVNIPTGTNAVELQVIMPLLSKQPQATLFSGQRLVWEVDTVDADPKALLCPKKDGGSTSGNLGCRKYGTEGDKALKQFDPQNITLTLDQQIGLPLGKSN